MPFPNEHSLRLKPPGIFDKDSFRRTAGGTLFGGKMKVPSSISLIWAKLSGRAKPSAPPILQAMRFKKSSWTVSSAKAWIKKNISQSGSFEPAKKLDESEVDSTTTEFNPEDEIIWDLNDAYDTGEAMSFSEASFDVLEQKDSEVDDDTKALVKRQYEQLMSDYNDSSDGEDEETFTVEGVEIFGVGTFRGDKYSATDLQTIVSNFSKFKNLIKPPCKLGHGDQKLLQASGLPAAGWVSRLSIVGKKLLADFTDVPRAVYNLIKKRAYKRVSVEIYPNYQDQSGKRHGLALSGLAFLGGDIPAVKSLRDIEALYDDDLDNKEIRRLVYMATPAEEKDLETTIDKDEEEEVTEDVKVEEKEDKPKEMEPVKEQSVDELAETKARMTELTEQLVKYSTVIEAQQTAITDLKTQAEAQKEEAAGAKDAVMLDGLTAAGKFPPALREKSLVLMSALRKSDETVSYTEQGNGDAEPVEVDSNPHALFTDILNALPVQMDMSEQSTGDTTTETGAKDGSHQYKKKGELGKVLPVEGQEIVAAIDKYMAEHDDVEYAEALLEVSRIDG